MYTEDGKLLNRMLHEAVGDGPLAGANAIARELHALCEQAGDADEHEARDRAAARIASLDEATVADVLRLVTVRFHLLNKAEQLSIAEINRRREGEATAASPRAESLDEATVHLQRAGWDAPRVRDLLATLDIEPTLTAHPTEARRRTILDKQLSVARCVTELRRKDLLPRERDEIEDRLRRIIATLLVTDDVRARRLEVPEEVRNGLYYLRSSIWQTVPRLMRDLVHAARTAWGEDAGAIVLADLPPLLRYRSWIGGDRDGNPNVTHEVTRRTIATLRETAAELWDGELENLRQQLSISIRRAPKPRELIERIEADHARVPGGWISPRASEMLEYEPFRYRLRQMRAFMCHDEAYDGAALLDDLLLLRRSLVEIGLAEVGERGPLADAIVRARVFGFHLAALDIRQHSRVHAEAVGELLGAGGVADNYADMSEDERLAVLSAEVASPRPLRPIGVQLSEQTTELLATLEVVRDAVAREPASVRSYIISMTDSVSDVLEVLLLMKETGLYRPGLAGTDSGARSLLHIVPLFETIDDLERAPRLTGAILDHPAYRRHLVALANEFDAPLMQEIMLGYSDSNKDGGFFMANTALHAAQQAIAEAVRARGVELRFFHGRGGTVGRGGGRAGRAILATPPAARTGRIRFTEQGEVISFRYAMPEIARRHLEQIVHAAMLAGAQRDAEPMSRELSKIYHDMAHRSMAAYRGLIDAPAFWAWFLDATPIASIAGLPIASRPVSRAKGGFTFDSLRAIPWVFSWIQIRALVPGWFGLGTAMGELSDDHRALIAQDFERGGFLATVLDNAMQEMARARPPIARRYALAAQGGDTIWPAIEREFASARDALLALTGRPSLLAHSKAIERAIAYRNPWTDVLNLIQIDLLGRARRGTDADRERLTPLLQSSVNGIAAGMQSTG
ncbi:MAG: phosphoenolpyruvate carboxylase [Phycisphaeraceae bacterium]|nr:MAG: phosphoenolpyruvate carboxylase [Phycisphaeraceae bacterium]